MNTFSSLPVIHADGNRPFPPPRTEFTNIFWEGLKERRFLATHCESCQKISFPPKPFCPHCWGRKVHWRELVTHGVVYSATIVHAAPKIFQAQSPYHVCIVDLDDGVRLATRLIGVPSGINPINLRVELVVVKYDDGPLFAARIIPQSTDA